MEQTESCGSLTDGRTRTAIVMQDEDIPVLLGIRDATFITIWQLWKMLNYRNYSYTRDQLKHRVFRLAKAGLLDTHPPVAIERGFSYSITRYGLSCLEFSGYGMVSISSDTERLADPIQIVHALQLNTIMLTFFATGKVTGWLTDRLVRNRNVLSTSPFAKDYDAVCTIDRADGRKQDVGVEFERTLKSRERYVEIKQTLSREARLSHVMYFVLDVDAISVIAGYLGTPGQCVISYIVIGDFRRLGIAAQSYSLGHDQQSQKLISIPLMRALSVAL